jgi:hypothetical protein
VLFEHDWINSESVREKGHATTILQPEFADGFSSTGRGVVHYLVAPIGGAEERNAGGRGGGEVALMLAEEAEEAEEVVRRMEWCEWKRRGVIRVPAPGEEQTCVAGSQIERGYSPHESFKRYSLCSNFVILPVVFISKVMERSNSGWPDGRRS